MAPSSPGLGGAQHERDGEERTPKRKMSKRYTENRTEMICFLFMKLLAR